MKKALLINALFSGVSGSVLILFQKFFASVFEFPSTSPFWILGTALLFFSFTILYEVIKQNRIRIIWIIIQDLLWVFGSIYMLIAKPFVISTNGNIIILVIALIVLLMAINQFMALRKMRPTLLKNNL